MTNDDIANALLIFQAIDDEPEDSRTEDEALNILMAASTDDETISTNHPSVTRPSESSEDAATERLEAIARGDDDAVNLLVGIAQGKTTSQLRAGR